MFFALEHVEIERACRSAVDGDEVELGSAFVESKRSQLLAVLVGASRDAEPILRVAKLDLLDLVVAGLFRAEDAIEGGLGCARFVLGSVTGGRQRGGNGQGQGEAVHGLHRGTFYKIRKRLRALTRRRRARRRPVSVSALGAVVIVAWDPLIERTGRRRDVVPDVSVTTERSPVRPAMAGAPTLLAGVPGGDDA